MYNDQTFSNFLKERIIEIDNRNLRSGLISICAEIPYVESFTKYNDLLMKYSFSALWEEDNNISFMSLDKCKYIYLDGPKRFKAAKDFYHKNQRSLINIEQNPDPSSLAKIIYFFSYSDDFNRNINLKDVPNMEAILPKILIIRNNQKSWIRINAQFNNEKSLREICDDFFLISSEIISMKISKEKKNFHIPIIKFESEFEKSRRNLIKNIAKGIKLIDKNILEKIVLSARIKVKCGSKFYLNKILKSLRDSNCNSCIYVWKRNEEDITFGASPEKLFSLKNNKLSLEAIAGSADSSLNNNLLLSSLKNIREHEIVLSFLINCLKDLNIIKFEKSDLKVKSFGNISHLQTILNASVNNLNPFEVLSTLHPSPAVCGIPTNIANEWIKTLETFPRGNYASPIGWIDFEGNTDFRVAIRGARYLNQEIQLTAGAGLVKDSICLNEVQEIKLKFEAIAKHIFY
tara:strand:+ start:1793 stop:3172 length:1380 start_codon:yes stop_codon:yes gene_type:complete